VARRLSNVPNRLDHRIGQANRAPRRDGRAAHGRARGWPSSRWFWRRPLGYRNRIGV